MFSMVITIDAVVEKFTPVADSSKPGHARIKLVGRTEELLVATPSDFTNILNGRACTFWIGGLAPDTPGLGVHPSKKEEFEKLYESNEVGTIHTGDLYSEFFPLRAYSQ